MDKKCTGSNYVYINYGDQILEDFWEKIIVDKDSGCWIWTSNVIHEYGYFALNGKKILTHRFVYELNKGKIPNGLELDHLCRNRRCCNPDHLEPVTRRENLLRGLTGLLTGKLNLEKKYCKNGHLFNQENTYLRKDKLGRECKQCSKSRNLKFREGNKFR